MISVTGIHVDAFVYLWYQDIAFLEELGCANNYGEQTENFDVVYQLHVTVYKKKGILVIIKNISTTIPFAQ